MNEALGRLTRDGFVVVRSKRPVEQREAGRIARPCSPGRNSLESKTLRLLYASRPGLFLRGVGASVFP